ncbi:benzoate-CoA ligase family protein [Desulfoscipio gibsoniae]|uniref:Benzoate-CoA ligase family n=1 Tax=Desulfoscipio gibsoniae DSM 7213 TaxID=767817 RepID=R4KKT1_9FIRM|nr:benzoate-CoA ligase family protein [Desulfoscipio gibsoniae]AGL03269.1 benzoate-CoA ligase family [Desulfoscipio gibsoniae DSM 7213]
MELTNIPDEFNIASYLLDRHLIEGRGNKVAVYYEDRVFTYAEIAEMANRAGNALLGLGVEQENRVLICLPDSPEFLAVYFGTIKIGAVPVPVSTMALPKDYLYFLNDSRTKALITNSELAQQFVQVQNEFRYLRHFAVVGQPQPGQLSFDELISKASPELTAVSTSKDDMAFWLYSSGTTGTPKGVVHLHHDLLHFMPSHCREVVSMTEEDIILSVSKIFFSYGRNNSLDSTFLCGASVVLYPGRPEPEKFFDVIEKYRPTLFYGVPSAYWAMLNYLEKTGRKVDLSSVRLCVSAGEALPKVIFDKWKEIFGLEILDGPGSTDVGAIYMSNKPGQIKPGSSGKLLTGFEGQLLDEDKNEVPRGEIGTLWIKNDGTTACYWNKHDKTKQSIHGEWFNTGDQFYQDEDGYFWYAGRADDMIKPSGLWVSPLEVEGVMLEHPAVNEVGVVGEVNESGLEKAVAFVVYKEGYTPSQELENELREYVRGRIAHYKCPQKFYLVKELPRTATGKVQRYKLRQLLG